MLLNMTMPNKSAKPQASLRTIKVKGIHASKQAPDSKLNNSTQTNQGDDGNQLEAMVNKGLDLAEVGIGLGVDIVARLGSIFKDQVFDKFNTADILNAVMSKAPAEQHATDEYRRDASNSSTNPAQTDNQNTAVQAHDNTPYLFNRLSLQPGTDVSLSFSINNDSLTTSKPITISIEKFTGQLHQNTIDASVFSITPDSIAIAPADFEKFVLTGKLPPEILPDTYRGWINVAEQQTYRIPVVLVVSALPQAASVDQQTLMASQTSIG
jgi:hypothetical protein